MSRPQNPAGTAPYFRDTSAAEEVALSESTAIASYILAMYSSESGAARMVRTSEDADFARYLEWFHFANGSLQATVGRLMTLTLAGAGQATADFAKRMAAKLQQQLAMMDGHLGQHRWFAGAEVSAADCMIMFSLSTMRGLYPYDLGPYPQILRWMKDVAARPAYLRALEKGDDGMEPMIGATTRKFTEFAAVRAALEKAGL